MRITRVARAGLLCCSLAVLFVAAACLGGDATHPSTRGQASSSSAEPTRLPTTAAVSVRRIPVGYGAYDVAAGAGSVWAAVAHGVTRLDPNTGRVTGRVRAANSLEWTNVAADTDTVWYLSGDGRRVVVRSIDPGTLRILSAIQFGISNGYDAFEGVAGTRAGVCVGVLASHPPRAAVCIGRGVDGGLTIPISSSQVGVVPMASVGPETVMLGGDAIRLVNLRSGRVTTIPVPPHDFVSALASDGSHTWAIATRPHKPAQLCSVLGDQVVPQITLPLVGVSAVAARGGRVWLLAGSHVYTVTPAGTTRPIASVPTNSHGLVATATALWTTQYQAGTVTRISRR